MAVVGPARADAPTRRQPDGTARRAAGGMAGHIVTMPDSLGGGGGRQAEQQSPQPEAPRRVSFLDMAAYVLAPGTAVIGLLYYYGNTYTEAYYSFFGIPPGDLQLSVQAYLVKSPRAIFLTVWPLFYFGLTLVMLLVSVDNMLAAPRLVARRRVVARWLLVSGMLIMLAPWLFSVLGWWVGGEPGTSVSLLVTAMGSALYFSGLWVGPAAWRTSPGGRRMWLFTKVMYVGMVAGVLFWFVAGEAAAAGRQDAESDAAEGFKNNPEAVIHSRVKIAHDAPGITVADEGSESGPYRFRYTGFVALAKSPTHFYLVPRDWKSGEVVVILPDDGSFRVEMRPT
ncbi:hypothetical protein [Streptomyces sp. NPDC048603]|uniref:hypothetical protein n=1 Tax=Streptomyces sp. NPDC048603 TaxID=3365577 RepID=UPI003719053C